LATFGNFISKFAQNAQIYFKPDYPLSISLTVPSSMSAPRASYGAKFYFKNLAKNAIDFRGVLCDDFRVCLTAPG
jgi:hypothetical protein